MKINKYFILFCFCSGIIQNSVLATTIGIGPVYLDYVSVVGDTAFGHQAGNLEIKIGGGINNSSVACDQSYVTTRKDAPNFNIMVSFLLAAQMAGRPVKLGISDDPALTAFYNRCSLVVVEIPK
jgi:hypothetical protein